MEVMVDELVEQNKPLAYIIGERWIYLCWKPS